MRRVTTFAEEREERLPLRRFGAEVPEPKPGVEAAVEAMMPQPEPSLEPIETEWLKTMELEGIPVGGPLRAERELRMAPTLAPIVAAVGKPRPELTPEMVARSARRNWARIKKPFAEMTPEDVERGAGTSLANVGKVYPVVDAGINALYSLVVGFPLHMGAFVGGLATDVGEWMAGQGFDLESARFAHDQIASITAATPFTEGGAQLLQASFGYLDDIARKGGESVVDATESPTAGATVYATLQILPYVLGARLLRKGRESKRPLTEEDVRLTVEDLKEEVRPAPEVPPEPKIAKTPEELLRMKEPIERAAPIIPETPIKSSAGGLSGTGLRKRFDVGLDTYEMTVGGKREIFRMTPEGIEEIGGVEPRFEVAPAVSGLEANLRRVFPKSTMEETRMPAGETSYDLSLPNGKKIKVVITEEVREQGAVYTSGEGKKVAGADGVLWTTKDVSLETLRHELAHAYFDNVLGRPDRAVVKSYGEERVANLFMRGEKSGDVKVDRVISKMEPEVKPPRVKAREERLKKRKPISKEIEDKVVSGELSPEEVFDLYRKGEAPTVKPPPIEKPPTPKLTDQIRTHLEEGDTIAEVAKKVDMTPEAVGTAMKRNKLYRPKKLLSAEDAELEIKKVLDDAKGDLRAADRNLRDLSERLLEDTEVGFKDPIDQAMFEDRLDMIWEGLEARAKARGISLAPEDTVSFGGTEVWGKMYREFVGRMRRRREVGETPLPTEAREMLDIGEIVKRRRVKGKYRPTIRRAEFEVFKGAKVLDENRFWGRGLQNPHYTFEEAGGWPMLDLTMHPYQAAVHAATLMKEGLRKRRGELSKGLSRRDKEKIKIYDVSKQKRGVALLEKSGVSKERLAETIKAVEASPKLMDTYRRLRDIHEDWYKTMSDTRESIGKSPFPKEENYSTFVRNLTLMERAGFKSLHARPEVFASQYAKASSMPFRFGKRRVGGMYKLELDPFRALEMYEELAADYVHLSPLIAKMREMQTTIIDPVTGKDFLLANENPVLAKSLDSWTNYIAGMRPAKWQLPPGAERVLLRINNNLTAAILAFMARSGLIQPMALKNTATIIGFDYTARGIASLLSDAPSTFKDIAGITFKGRPLSKNLAMQKSKHLLSRVYEVAQKDVLDSIRRGEGKRWATKQGMKPLQILDFEAAKATFQGAYEYALKELKYGDKKAAVWADDVVITTQASALPGHIAPIQRAVVGRVITLFQTFVINDWNFLIRHVLGKSNASIDTHQALARTMRWLAAATLLNILYEDVLGINSPHPTPIKSFKESLEKGDSLPSLAWNVGKEFIEPIPIVGAARYGKGPGGAMTELTWESMKYITRQPMAKPALELGGKWIGVPGTGQIAKTIRARKRGETPYGQIVGTYTPAEERAEARRARRQTARSGRRVRSRAR